MARKTLVLSSANSVRSQRPLDGSENEKVAAVSLATASLARRC